MYLDQGDPHTRGKKLGRNTQAKPGEQKDLEQEKVTQRFLGNIQNPKRQMLRTYWRIGIDNLAGNGT